MNSITRKNISQARSIHYLSSCTYHFQCMDNIQKNIYMMTIHFRNINKIDYSLITKQLHKSINRAVVNKDNPRNNKNSGLFVNFDIEGTREYKPVIDTYICPHVHCCIFLQASTINGISDDDIISCIKKEIFKRSSYLNSQIEYVWIEKYDETIGDLLSYLSYSSKAENFEGITSKIAQTTFLYPYENKSQKMKSIADGLHINDKQQVKELEKIQHRIEGVANLIATKPMCVFGDIAGEKTAINYLDLYEDNYGHRIASDATELFSFIQNLVKPERVRFN